MKRSFVPALLLACAVGTAQAGSLTQTLSAPAATVPTSDTFLFNQFNPSLGTLTSVDLSLTSNIVADVSVLNSLTTAQGFTNAMASVPFGVTGPDGISFSLTASTPGQSSPPLAPVAAGADVALPGSAVTASVATTLSSPGEIASYIGTGINDLAFVFTVGAGTFSITAANGVFVSGSATADATVVLTYNYTSATVPEPSSAILAAIGIVGVAALGHRRRRAA